MNQKNIWIAAGVAVAGIATYFIRKAFMKKAPEAPVKKSHHLTNAFSKAKEVALSN